MMRQTIRHREARSAVVAQQASRHREARSAVAILGCDEQQDCFTSFAMTRREASQ
jgi:hypothetical protein